MDCTALSDIVISPNVVSIGIAAFANCDSLCSPVLPESLSFVSPDAFLHCGQLTEAVYGGSRAQYDAFGLQFSSVVSVCCGK